MAILSNVNGKFAVDSTGAIQFSGSAGTSGYILRSNGNAAPTWVDSSTVIGGPYLPLTGGTLSGALAGTSATFTGSITGTTASFTRLDVNAINTKLKGDLLGNVDAAYDIGASGANRPRNLYLSNSITAGDITTTGVGTFGGNVGVGNSGTFDNPNSFSKVIEIANSDIVGLILNDTRDANPMSISNEGAVMHLRYNTTSLLSLIGSTGAATFAGNLGIGVTPEAWTVFKTSQIGQASAFVGRISSNQTDVATNFYYDGAEKRITTGYAQRYTQTSDGKHQFWTAGTDSADSAITFSKKFEILNNGNATFAGNVGIGVSTVNNPFTAQAALQVGDTSTGTNNGLITIGSGTTGSGDIYFADGTSGGSQYRGFVSYKHNGDYLAFGTAETTRMIIDSSGNVGIGTASPSDLYADKLVVNCNGSEDGITIVNGSYIMWADGTSGNDRFRGQISYAHSIDAMLFATDAVERMRITSGGDIEIPTNEASIRLRSSGSGSYTSINRDSSNTLVIRNTANNAIFALENGGNMTIAGTLTQGSDISYKENIKPLESQLDIVNKLNPVSYNRIGKEENEIGFIAQEVEKLIPDLVSENPDGLKSLAYGNMTSILVKSIQELEARIKELENK